MFDASHSSQPRTAVVLYVRTPHMCSAGSKLRCGRRWMRSECASSLSPLADRGVCGVLLSATRIGGGAGVVHNDPAPVVSRSATCRSRLCFRLTTTSAMRASIVFAVIRWMSSSFSSYMQSVAPIAEAISIARFLDARAGKAGRSASVFGPTSGSDQVTCGNIIVCCTNTTSL